MLYVLKLINFSFQTSYKFDEKEDSHPKVSLNISPKYLLRGSLLSSYSQLPW